jgi:CheY-like chemotaxis protein
LINQRLLVKLLTILDCDTHTCNDGQQCVSLLQSLAQSAQANTFSFDIILMDLEMYGIVSFYHCLL